jgi:hypothetical protein
MLCVQVSAKPCLGARDILTAWSVDNGQIWSESVAGRLVRETVDPVGCGCVLLHWLLAMNNSRSRQDTYGTYGLSSIALEVIRCICDPWNCLYVVSFLIILVTLQVNKQLSRLGQTREQPSIVGYPTREDI